MSDSPGAFAEKASQFIRNPLGIIGLFIVLIYSTTVIVAGVSGELTDNQRSILIVFAAIFPFVVLGTFFRLVTKHHAKLYAPSDWKNEIYVFGLQSAETKQRRQEAEAAQVAEIDTGDAEALPPDAEATTDPTGADDVEEKLAPVISEITKTVNRSRFREYIKIVREAEVLAFNYLSESFPGEIVRDVTLHGGPKDVSFDGLSKVGLETTIFEVRVIRSVKSLPYFLGRLTDSLAIASAANVNQRGPSSLRIVLVIVPVDMDESEISKIRSVSSRALGEVRGVSYQVEVIDLRTLRDQYANSPDVGSRE